MEKTRFLELANKRISVRDYKNLPIDRESLNLCLEAARLAPSACNSQPWKFIVVDDKKLKEKLCKKAFSGIYSINAFAKKAPVIIAVVQENSALIAKVGGQFKNTRYYLIDLGIACEHLVLQATELGIGTCLIGWFNEKAVKKTLSIPRPKRVELLISLGYHQEIKKKKIRRSLNEISSYNRY